MSLGITHTRRRAVVRMGECCDTLRATYAEVERLREERDALRARVADLEEHRARLDCRFAGRYAEVSGSHCPADDACQRCRLERAEEDIAIRDAALRDAGLTCD